MNVKWNLNVKVPRAFGPANAPLRQRRRKLYTFYIFMFRICVDYLITPMHMIISFCIVSSCSTPAASVTWVSWPRWL